MRVCVVSTYFQPVPVESWGGIEIQVDQQARGLASLGHEVHVLTVGTDRRIETLDRDGIHYHRLGMGTAFATDTLRVAAGIWRFSRGAHLLCQRLAPDIVHYHSRFALYLSSLMKGGGRPPWARVYHAHVWKPGDRMSFPAFSIRRGAAAVGRLIDYRISQRCDRLVAVSRFMKERIVKTARVNPEKISILPNFIDLDWFTPSPEPQYKPEVVFVGRVAKEKGVLTLIEAMARVAREIPAAALTIVGPATGGTEYGSYMGLCKERVAELGLEEQVRFVGEVPNQRLGEFLRPARLMVLPSICDETFGLVVIEGMSCGLAVVGSQVGGVTELIQEGQTGLLVPPEDPAALGKAIIEGLSSDDLTQSAARMGPRFVAESHTWGAVRDCLEEIQNIAVSLTGSGPLGDKKKPSRVDADKESGAGKVSGDG